MSTMAEVAERAGVARSTLYAQFDSRYALVDAICGRFAAGVEYAEIKRSQELPDPVAALRGTMFASVRFWSRDHDLHRSIHGLVEIDPAASALVERQTDERRNDLRRLVRRLRKNGALGRGWSTDDAVGVLLVATSFPTYAELRGVAGLGTAATEKAVVRLAETILTPARRPGEVVPSAA
jgi:AcrR family transcriptional regulator